VDNSTESKLKNLQPDEYNLKKALRFIIKDYN